MYIFILVCKSFCETKFLIHILYISYSPLTTIIYHFQFVLLQHIIESHICTIVCSIRLINFMMNLIFLALYLRSSGYHYVLLLARPKSYLEASIFRLLFKNSINGRHWNNGNLTHYFFVFISFVQKHGVMAAHQLSDMTLKGWLLCTLTIPYNDIHDKKK